MEWLILSVLASTGLLVIFELTQKQGAKLFPVIIVNYLVCAICGNALLGPLHIFQSSTITHPAFYYMLFMGFMFIGTFFLMGTATARAGSSKASVASKMSVIVPVSASIILLNQPTSTLQIIGILIGLLCVYFITKQSKKNPSLEPNHALILLFVFIGSGLVDTGLNMLSHFFDKAHSNSPVFIATFIFTIAFILGLSAYIVLMRGKYKLSVKELLFGILLGLVNFFSLYCVFKALQSFQGHTAYYWMLNNIGVVLLSTLVSVLVFKRKLDNYNYIGLGLAIFAIVLLNI